MYFPFSFLYYILFVYCIFWQTFIFHKPIWGFHESTQFSHLNWVWGFSSTPYTNTANEVFFIIHILKYEYVILFSSKPGTMLFIQDCSFEAEYSLHVVAFAPPSSDDVSVVQINTECLYTKLHKLAYGAIFQHTHGAEPDQR